MKSKIFFAEDDLILGLIIAKALEDNGFEVNYQNSLAGIHETIAQFHPHLLILDIEFGTNCCLDKLPSIRLTCPSIPIIIASSHVDGKEIARSYTSGANLYIKKPYDIDELLYHINQLLTDKPRTETHIIPFSSYKLDITSRELYLKENKIKQLSPKEFYILEILLKNQGKFVERTELLNKVWGNELNEGSLNNIITSLRKYFSEGGDIHIITNKGKGYQLTIE